MAKVKRSSYTLPPYMELKQPKYQNAKYWIFKGSKYSGKSQEVAQIIIETMLAKPKSNFYVYMKNALDHDGKTMVELKKAIKMFEKKTKGFFKASDWEWFGKPDRRAVRKTTGQQIIFLAFDSSKDNNKSSGRKPTVGYVAGVWLEEPESSNALSKPANNDSVEQTIADWDTALLSIERNEGQYLNELVRVMVSYNPYEASGWIGQKYGRPTDEDFEKLKKFGCDIYHDPDYEGGVGKVVITTNYRCNKYIGKHVIAKFQTIEKNDPHLARTVCFGMTAHVKNAALSNEVRRIVNDPALHCSKEEVIKKCEDYVYGLDWGNNDKVAMTLTGINTFAISKTRQNQEWMYTEWAKIENPFALSAEEKLQWVIEKVIEWYKSYKMFEIKKRVEIEVDNSVPDIIDMLNVRMKFYNETNQINDTIKVVFVKCRKWNKIGGLPARLRVFKLFVALNQFKFNVTHPLFNDFINEAKKKTVHPVTGEVSNTGDDLFQSGEYTWTRRINPYLGFK